MLNFLFSDRSSSKCIPAHFVCDGQLDCANGEDESACVDYTQQPTQKYSFFLTKCFKDFFFQFG